jgi:hypothetical protein
MLRAYSGEATDTNFIVFGKLVWLDQGSNPLSTALDASSLKKKKSI